MALDRSFVTLNTGLTVAYHQVPAKLDPSKPTIVYLHAMGSPLESFAAELRDEKLRAAANLLAIDQIAHGATDRFGAYWTHWDNARLVIEVMEKLGIERAFFYGVSMGGYVIARIAILDQAKVQGFIVDSSSAYGPLDPEAISLGCLDSAATWDKMIVSAAHPSDPPSAWLPPFDEYDKMSRIINGGKPVPPEHSALLRATLTKFYSGEEGRKKFLGMIHAARDREGLYEDRLRYITCPVLWLHGELDGIYPIEVARRSASWLTGSKKAEFEVVKGIKHCVNRSASELTIAKTLEFVKTNA